MKEHGWREELFDKFYGLQIVNAEASLLLNRPFNELQSNVCDEIREILLTFHEVLSNHSQGCETTIQYNSSNIMVIFHVEESGCRSHAPPSNANCACFLTLPQVLNNDFQVFAFMVPK